MSEEMERAIVGKHTMSINIPVDLYVRLRNRKDRTGESLATMYTEGIKLYLEQTEPEKVKSA